MTVKELKDKLRNAPNDAQVYMLTDKSNDNWDEDKGYWSVVYPLAYVSRERIDCVDGWFDDGKDELNILLEIEEA